MHTTGISSAARTASTGGATMRYNHPLEWKACFSPDERQITITRPSGSHIYFKAMEGNSAALPIGSSRKLAYRVRLLNKDFSPNEQGTPSWLDMVLPSGMVLRFSADTGEVTSVTTSSGNVVSAQEYARKVQVIRNEDGTLNSVYSEAQGLMRSISENGRLTLEWYAPGKASSTQNGKFAITGEPYKTAVYETFLENGVKVTHITNQRAGQEPHYIERREENNKTTIIKGKGEERIVRTIERNALADSKWERIETVRGINEEMPSSCIRTVKKYTDGGWLTISSTEGYNTPNEQTTLYTYNDQYRLSLEIKPDGGYTRYEYDEEGREILEAEPWAGGGEQATRTTYADLRFNDYRPATRNKLIIEENGRETVINTKVFTYENSPQINRTTVTETALGSSQVHTSVEETYGEAFEYPYARGRKKFSQDVNGVQIVYLYKATTDHGAIHKITETLQANGSIVSGQSTRNVEYIAENGTTTRKEQYAHTGEDWALISSEDYEYDDEQRLIKTTRGNGRTSTTEWMCCGPLRETDEDGITTSYSYNTARQLVETIRSATETTPEIIISYTRDADGRILTTRKDMGAMTTEERTEYDTRGRIISSTDILGRVTRTEYSDDELTTTVTTPSGGTLVTKKYYDGSILWQGGTRQRETETRQELTKDGILTTILSRGVALSRTLENGFGQIVRQEQPDTRGGWIVTRNIYNGKRQMIRTQTEDMAPTVTCYDNLGYAIKRIVLLDELHPDDTTRNRISESSSRYQAEEDGIYQVKTSTIYNAQGLPLIQTMWNLVSQLNPVLKTKSIVTDIYGQQSIQWTECTAPFKYTQLSRIPTSDIVSKSCVVDGFTVSQVNHAGIRFSRERFYTSTGITLKETDGRGNTTITEMDIARRPVKITDASGNVTTATYNTYCDEPAVITNAQGKTFCSTYDVCGRKVAEWGTGIQAACFGYDEAGRMVSMTTFRANEEEIISDPSGRSDGDTTTWFYDTATGLELKKIYADGSCVSKTYDGLNRQKTLTKAGGTVTTYSYAALTGELISVTHSDGTQPWLFSCNHLGQTISVRDASGLREFSYDSYGKLLQDTSFGLVESCLQEEFDLFGRSSGYRLMIGTQTVQHSHLDYNQKGGIIRMNLEGLDTPFTWEYDNTSGFLKQLVYPNGMIRKNIHHPNLNLLTVIDYEEPENGEAVTSHEYQYDTLKNPMQVRDSWDIGTAPTTRDFTYNNRGELINQRIQQGGSFAYQYDNIGNRKTARELEEEISYTAGSLNQYSDVIRNGAAFAPIYDADGNQTRIKTSTGIWEVIYDANDRPVSFTSGDGRTVISCGYDYEGHRFEKKVTVNGTVLSHVYYLYRGYLQIAELDLMHPEAELTKTNLWDPTEPMSTRVLMTTCWKEKGKAVDEHFYFMHDALKNVTSIFGEQRERKARYEYAPFGELLTAEGDRVQFNKFRFSCEYEDDELGLIYYNYRYLNPLDGRWINRDPIQEQGGRNMYGFISNSWGNDYLGLQKEGSFSSKVIGFFKSCDPGNKSLEKMTFDLTEGKFDTGSWNQFYNKVTKVEISGLVKITSPVNVEFPIGATLTPGDDIPTFSFGFSKLTILKVPFFTLSASGEWKQQEDDKCKGSLHIKSGEMLKGLTLNGTFSGNWENGFSQEQYVPSTSLNYTTKIAKNLSFDASVTLQDLSANPLKAACLASLKSSGSSQDGKIRYHASLSVNQDIGPKVPPTSIKIEGSVEYKPNDNVSFYLKGGEQITEKNSKLVFSAGARIDL